MNKLKKSLLYGGLEKDKYDAIRNNISEVNRASLISYATIAGVGMAILFILSFFFEVLESSRISYAVVAIISLIMILLNRELAKRYPLITYFSVYIFSSLLLAFGIALGTVVEPNQASASFGILLFAIPMLFVDRPIITDIQIATAMIVYTFAARATQTPEMFLFNMSVVVPYGVVSILLCRLVMGDKIVKQSLHNENERLSKYDQLTGICNRRCYEEYLQKLDTEGCLAGTKFCVFDVNDLKEINDTLGHKAGDEMLIAASEIIEDVFGKYGRFFRIGGDEFVVVIEGEMLDSEELIAEFNRKCDMFVGENVKELSIAVGIYEFCQGDTVEDAIHKADQKMYACKAEYHATH